MKQAINTLLQAPSVPPQSALKVTQERMDYAAKQDFKALLNAQIQAKDNRIAHARQKEDAIASRANANKAVNDEMHAQAPTPESKQTTPATAKEAAQRDRAANMQQVDFVKPMLDDSRTPVDLMAASVEVLPTGIPQSNQALNQAIELNEASLIDGTMNASLSAVLPNGEMVVPMVFQQHVPVDARSQATLAPTTSNHALETPIDLTQHAQRLTADREGQLTTPFNPSAAMQIRSGDQASGMNPSRFLEAMRDADMQTSHMEKALLNATSPTPMMGMAEASIKSVAMVQSAATGAIQTPFGQTGWHQEVQQKVVWMTSGGLEAATLNLNPPELGPLKVVIQVHNQQADALFISDNADVRLALKESMEQLREAMRGSAITLGETEVNANGQQHFQQHPEKQAQFNAINTRVAPSHTALAEPAPQPSLVLRAHDGLVNTFA